MEDKRPYLDEKLNLDSFSKAVFSNKVYVSKNINHYSGKNFRQFINWYRIQYALDLMKKDPHLRMEEVAMMSGFHTTVSFNMAFRLFVAKTPTEWHEEYVDSLRKG
jgi:YesN/AraC family two-component response regulator